MSEEERIWANALSDAIEPANEYARKIKAVSYTHLTLPTIA